MSKYGSRGFLVGINTFASCFFLLPIPAIPFPSFRHVLLTPNTGGTDEEDVGCTGCVGCSSSSLAGCWGDTDGADGAVGADVGVGFAECTGSFSGSTSIGHDSSSLAAAGGADEDEAVE